MHSKFGHLTASGEPIRGDRKTEPTEANVVGRVITDYAAGLSPKKIAEALNIEGVLGPLGRGWGASHNPWKPRARHLFCVNVWIINGSDMCQFKPNRTERSSRRIGAIST
ncbi:recombinase family protein [Roseovarius arcticus]|uniref:recombinase family protein n=1 Tax=Roseovarius arcticus TaxID=2547404 RepID=UPI001FE75AD2|nr:recombinase family protein [Roseovarius arcticus]